jgi:hypothetical protein
MIYDDGLQPGYVSMSGPGDVKNVQDSKDVV